ncbi:hypothetical protein F5Y16DRAFT_402546 [Xylariaceae sp. FL0255]|nr:hypothetical protein F5Y16DRAFT_402546 [Xylariaceae sp. FL0255]
MAQGPKTSSDPVVGDSGRSEKANVRTFCTGSITTITTNNKSKSESISHTTDNININNGEEQNSLKDIRPILAAQVGIISLEQRQQDPQSFKIEPKVLSIAPSHMIGAVPLNEERVRDLLSAICTLFSFSKHPGQITAAMLRQHSSALTVYVSKNQGLSSSAQEIVREEKIRKNLLDWYRQTSSPVVTDTTDLSFFTEYESKKNLDPVSVMLLSESDKLSVVFQEGIKQFRIWIQEKPHEHGSLSEQDTKEILSLLLEVLKRIQVFQKYREHKKSWLKLLQENKCHFPCDLNESLECKELVINALGDGEKRFSEVVWSMLRKVNPNVIKRFYSTETLYLNLNRTAECLGCIYDLSRLPRAKEHLESFKAGLQGKSTSLEIVFVKPPDIDETDEFKDRVKKQEGKIRENYFKVKKQQRAKLEKEFFGTEYRLHCEVQLLAYLRDELSPEQRQQVWKYIASKDPASAKILESISQTLGVRIALGGQGVFQKFNRVREGSLR